MKSLKIITLLIVVAATLCNCSVNNKNGPAVNIHDSFYYHLLLLSFQDASGTDLIKGIEFDRLQLYAGTVRSDYTLNAVYPDGITNPVPYYTIDNNEGILFEDDKDHLSFASTSYKVRYDSRGIEIKEPFVEKIIYKLRCPYIFGDDETHEIVTWWEAKTEYDYGKLEYALCCRIEFNGKVFTEIKYISNNNISVTTLIW